MRRIINVYEGVCKQSKRALDQNRAFISVLCVCDGGDGKLRQERGAVIALILDRLARPENVAADMRAKVSLAQSEDAQHMFVQGPVIVGDGIERRRNAG